MNQELKKRLLSLLWRAGMMALAVILDGFIKMLSTDSMGLNSTEVVLIGLILGEVSKAIRNRLVE